MKNLTEIQNDLNGLLRSNYTITDENGSIIFKYKNYRVTSIFVLGEIQNKYGKEKRNEFAADLLRYKLS